MQKIHEFFRDSLNFRDLGGLKTNSGKKVKSGLFYRGAGLNFFNDEEDGGTGLYACVIDAGDGNLIFSFRGTNGLSDVVFTDLDMLDSEETAMQKAAREYVKYVIEELRRKGKKINHVVFTGHSLGGNLAEHAAITAPEEIREQCEAISYDGPGYSNKYIRAHEKEIAEMRGKLHRFQWSFVGALLNQLDVEKYESVYTDTIDIPVISFIPGVIAPTVIYNSLNNIFKKHTNYAMIKNNCDENGRLKRGNKEAFAKDLEVATVFLDFIRLVKSYVPIPNTDLIDQYKAFVKRNHEKNETTRKKPGDSLWANELSRFSIRTERVRDCLDGLDSMTGYLEDFCGEIESIMKELSSFEGLWMKDDLIRVYNELQKNIDRCNRIKQVGTRCAYIYDKCEENIINRYSKW